MHASHRSRMSIVALSLAVLFSLVLSSTAFARTAASTGLVGPKKHYLALGDSLAFGFQPDLDFGHGYTHDFAADLKSHGGGDSANLACPGETSVTLIEGGCPYPLLRKFPYVGDQLTAALAYLAIFRGQVSPVTLSIGANDVIPYLNTKTCVTDTAGFATALSTLDHNLTTEILPKLRTALTVNGAQTGDLILLNYYDPYQNSCPNSVQFTQTLNQHLAADIQNFGTYVDVFSAFGGSATPNSHICSYTWMCSIFKDIHAKDAGYRVMANALEATVGYW